MTRRSEGRSSAASACSTRASTRRPGGAAAQDFRAEFVQRAADFRHHQRAREPRQGGEEAFQDFMHRRQIAQFVVFASTNSMVHWNTSGRGSAWLERLVRDQEVGGSNPLAPTRTSRDSVIGQSPIGRRVPGRRV